MGHELSPRTRAKVPRGLSLTAPLIHFLPAHSDSAWPRGTFAQCRIHLPIQVSFF